MAEATGEKVEKRVENFSHKGKKTIFFLFPGSLSSKEEKFCLH